MSNVDYFLKNLIQKARHLEDLYSQSGDIASLNEAISLWRSIQHHPDFLSSNTDTILVTTVSLSNILWNYFAYFNNNELVLHEAINYLTSIEHIAKETDYFYFNFGKLLRSRYACTGTISDLNKSIDCYQTAIILAIKKPSGKSYLEGYFNGLGNCFRDLYQVTRELKHLEDAIINFRKSVDLSRLKKNKLLHMSLTNLGSGLRNHAQRIYNDGIKSYDLVKIWQAFLEIEEAIILYSEAISVGEDLPNSHVLFNNLSRGFYTKYLLTNQLDSLNSSIDNLKKAIDLTPTHLSLDLAIYHANLGELFFDLYGEKRIADYITKATTALITSCKYGIFIGTKESLRGSSTWIEQSFKYQIWSETDNALPHFINSSRQLLNVNIFRQDKESWLKDMQGIATKTAYAFAKLDKPKEATEALEQGQARLLSESLSLTRTDLTALQNTEHAHLYEAYQETTQHWHWAQQHKPEKLKKIREQLDGVIEQIRQLPGYKKFLKPSGWADIELAAADTPLLYVLATEHGGLALLVPRDAKVQSLWLPDFTETALQKMLQGYLSIYRAWQEAGSKTVGDEFKAWCEELEKTTRRLWDCVFAPLQNNLPEELVLIPAGLLNLLPLHAAWTPDNSAPTGKRYALDNWRIRYAPNARSLHTARALREQTACNNALAIENPTGDIAYAAYLTPALRQLFPKCAPYNAGQASHDKVLKALPEYDVINFYCHGKTIPDDPLQSVLALADKNLTLDTLLKAGKLKARLVTLCACETGMIGEKLPDETVSLAAGILQAGAAGVISSLWSVADISTMILISRFYHLWRQDKLPPAESLRQAQIWLRDSTPEQRIAFFREVLPTAAVKELAEKLDQDFSHPYHWAAFGYVGV